MKERWECVKEITRNIKYYIPGDKIYVSNLGRVKLNDEILELGKGLSIDKGGNIYIVFSGISLFLHRLVYSVFNGELKSGIKYNVHHVDYDHLNNRADNLVQLSVREHGLLHREDQIDSKKWIKIQENGYKLSAEVAKMDEYKQSSLLFLYNRARPYWQEIEDKIQQKREEKIRQKTEKRERKERERQEEYERRLASPDYFISTNGVLRPKTTAKKGQHHSEETKKHQSEALKNLYKTRPDYYNSIKKVLLKGTQTVRERDNYRRVAIKDLETGIVYRSLKECWEGIHRSSSYVRKHPERFVRI